MRKLKGAEMAVSYGAGGVMAGVMADKWHNVHPHFYLLMAGGVGFLTLVGFISYFRVFND